MRTDQGLEELEREEIKTELALTPTEGKKSAEQVLPDDRADREIKASHYRFKRSWTIATVALAVYGLWATEGMVREAHKPPERIYVRVMPNGEFVQSKLTDYHYVPRPNDAELYLERWATFRYTRKRDTITKDFPKNYWFLERSLGEQMMANDAKRNVVANIISGRIPENQVESVHADILGFETRTIDGVQIGRGEALIDVILLFPEQMTEPHPRRVHLRVGVAFVLNPAQVQEKALLWPEYPKVNGAGLTIVKAPIENAVESK